LTISEKVFYERLEKKIGTEKTRELEQLIATLDSQFNITPSFGRGKKYGSINLKLPNGYNFGTLFDDSAIQFIENGRWKDKEEFHLKYIEKIAAIVNGQFEWKYIKKANGQWFDILDLLEIKDKWIEILTETIEEIYRLEEEND